MAKYITLNKDDKEFANMFYTLDNVILALESFPNARHINTTKREVVYEI